MKILIDIDKTTDGPTLDELIKNLFAEKGVPGCFGDMCPPIISKKITIDADTIIKHKSSVPVENISAALDRPGPLEDMVIDINGREYLNKLKKDMADKYVEKLIKCKDCQLHVLCNMLTTHYINTLALDKEE